MKNTVSIVVPVYNVSNHIERCLHSLFRQTYNQIEYIFIDDCTPDNSVSIINEILNQYPQRESQVRIIRHDTNKGLSAARNTGVAAAAGEFIQHIDSDDFVDIHMVEDMMRAMLAENADIVISDYYLQWKDSQKLVKGHYYKNKRKLIRSLLTGEFSPAVWNKMFRKSLYLDHQITAIEGVNYGEDLTVTPQLIYFADKIVKIDKAYVHYLQYNANSYTKKVSEKNLQDISYVYRYLYNFFYKHKDRDYYIDALKYGELKKKVELMKQINPKDIKLINKYFAKHLASAHLYDKLNYFDKVLLLLNEKKVYNLLSTTIFFYQKTQSSFQYLKNRK